METWTFYILVVLFKKWKMQQGSGGQVGERGWEEIGECTWFQKET